jgi:hypothetical protein
MGDMPLISISYPSSHPTDEPLFVHTDRLPNEVLAEVLYWTAPEVCIGYTRNAEWFQSDMTKNEGPLLHITPINYLRAVNSRFRAIVDATPRLWCYVYAHLSPEWWFFGRKIPVSVEEAGRRMLAGVHSALKRSGTRPIHFQVVLAELGDYPTTSEYITSIVSLRNQVLEEILTSYSQRIESLTIPKDKRVVAAMKDHSWTGLKHLRVLAKFNIEVSSISDSGDADAIEFNSLPPLTSLDIRFDWLIETTLPWHNISRLTLGVTRGSFKRFRALLEILKQCSSSLEFLDVHWMGSFDTVYTFPKDVVVLHRLRELALQGEHKDRDWPDKKTVHKRDTGQMLLFLACPALQILRVNACRPSALEKFICNKVGHDLSTVILGPDFFMHQWCPKLMLKRLLKDRREIRSLALLGVIETFGGGVTTPLRELLDVDLAPHLEELVITAKKKSHSPTLRLIGDLLSSRPNLRKIYVSKQVGERLNESFSKLQREHNDDHDSGEALLQRRLALMPEDSPYWRFGCEIKPESYIWRSWGTFKNRRQWNDMS